MNKHENRLIKDVEKKCTTIMIGSLARFEENFGYLWEKESGHQDKFDDLWQQTRNDILNFGNHHIRSVVEELYKYFLDQAERQNYKYHYELRFDNKKGDNK